MEHIRGKGFFIASLITTFFLFVFAAQAQVQYRGFQNTVTELREDMIKAAGFGSPAENYWQENIHRAILWFPQEDTVTDMETYWSYLDSELNYLDEMLPHFCAANTKVNIVLYSTPGGFCDRGKTGNTPTLCIFQQQWAQDGMIEIWDTLSKRYANSEYRECIHGLAIANETAEGNVASGLKTWNELIPDLISTIRANDEDVNILVPAAFADPKRLYRMPFIQDPNVLYVFHAYPNVKYAHSGIDGISTDINPPSDRALKNKIFRPIARMLHLWQKKQQKGEIPTDVNPKFFVSETTVTRMAKDADDYTRRLYSALEGENEDAGRSEDGSFRKKKCRKFKKTNKTKFKKCKTTNRYNKLIPQINVVGYISFPWRGAVDVFNPELPDGTGTNTVSLPNLTGRGAVVKEFFERNLD